jgi:Family of unknown function (DUF6221)
VILSLADFLRARLDEDGCVASAAHQANWSTDGRRGIYYGVEDGWMTDALTTADADHIARHHPKRVFAEVEAKRRLLDLHPHTTQREDVGERLLRANYGPNWETRLPSLDTPYCATCDVDSGVVEVDPQGRPCETLRLLAAPYADQADYQVEWRP